MALVEIKAQKRDKFKKGPSRQYRRDGLIPAIVYGQEENKNILINNKDFVKLSANLTKSTIINLIIDDGKKIDVLIKDYQKDYLRNKYMHIDFYELKAGKPVDVKISLNFIGIPAGVKEGGVLEKQRLYLEVECLPIDIIPSLDVNIGELNINESLHVRDIKLDEKYKIVSHPDEVIAHVSGKTALEEEPVKEQAVVTEEAAAEGAEEGKEEESKEAAESKEKEKK